MSSALQPQSRVVHGFQDAIQVAYQMYGRGTLVNILLPAGLADELVPAAAFGELADLIRRGGRVRLVTTGRITEQCLEACHEAGILHRWLAEARELGFVASERELLIFPVDQDAAPGFPESAVHVEDAVMAVRNLRSFNRTWDQALVQKAREPSMGRVAEADPG